MLPTDIKNSILVLNLRQKMRNNKAFHPFFLKKLNERLFCHAQKYIIFNEIDANLLIF